MKHIRYFLPLLLLLISCESDNKLTLETVEYRNTSCTNCPEISIQLPHSADKRKLSKVIDVALQEEVISLLSFDESEEVVDIESAIESFNRAFAEVNEFDEHGTAPWEVQISGELVYENKDIVCIGLNSYVYTGGAHGYGSTRFLNFDKKRAEELDVSALLSSREEFEKLAEREFRSQEEIPADSSINSTGFMFDGDQFYLPENIGFTEDGLVLLYNPYEVASYADGSIEMTLPYSEVKEYLSIGL